MSGPDSKKKILFFVVFIYIQKGVVGVVVVVMPIKELCKKKKKFLPPVPRYRSRKSPECLYIKVSLEIMSGTNSGQSVGVVGKNLPQGIPESHQTFLRSAAPRDSLMTRGNSRGQIFQTIPEDFPQVFRLLD